MEKGSIAVVVLTCNGKQYLPELFASLERTVCDWPWKLYIVDNASTDGTADEVSKAEGLKSKVTIIRNSKNLGFAAGNNVGIRKAFDDGAEYIALLNQDTVAEPHWLSELAAAAEDDVTIGAVQARLMLWDKKDLVNSLGNKIHFLGFGYAGGYGEKFGIRNSEFGITYASGAAVLYRANALREVGLFDGSLWMYHDDLDLGWRLWRAGWRSILAPRSIVYHKYEFSRSITKYYYMERNRFLVLLENYSLRALTIICPALVLMELGLLAKAFISGWGREKLRAYAFFLRPSTWRLILEQRCAKQKTFRRPERELLRRFTGRIAFQEVSNPILEYIANPFFDWYWKIMQKII